MKLLDRILGRSTGFRLGHIIKQVYYTPTLLSPEGFESVEMVLKSKLAGDVVNDFRNQEVETDLFGDPLPVMEIVDKVAIIPIAGVIGYRVSGIERVCGICDLADVKRNVQLARDDDQCEAILLNVSSPGGGVTHCFETAQVIADAAKVKPVLAFTDTVMASGAYLVSAGANEIYSTKTAEVGSIGSFMRLLLPDAEDDSELFIGEKAPYKAMGIKPLTPEQREYLQTEVDNITKEFKSFVTSVRPQVKPDAMQGQTLGMGKYPMFGGDDKVSIGLVDYIVNDMDDVIIN